MTSPYAALHVHTHYSLQDSINRPDDLFARAKELGIAALGITDHGVMSGVVKCAKAAEAHGVKFIAGLEGYLRRSIAEKVREIFHVTLLAKNAEGYRNLCRMSEISWTKGFYYKPCVDFDVLQAHHEGIVCLSGCLSGVAPKMLLNKKDPTEEMKRFRDIFGQDFFMEVMDHQMPEQRQILPVLVDLGRRLSVPIVATQDCHYTLQHDHQFHSVHLAIGKKTTPAEAAYATTQFYLKSPGEMAKLWQSLPEAVTNTMAVTERCEFVLDRTKHAPRFARQDVPDNRVYFRQLCIEGLKRRYGERPGKLYVDRLKYEVSVIERLGFVDYFLILHDLLSWCREKKIPVGPGRGSAAGSMVAYVLRITDVCPIRMNLLFERFLNPERVSDPDIDVDFCKERRGEVIQYLKERYGAENVARISAFHEFHAKGCIRDVGRTMGLTFPQTDELAGMVEDEKVFDREFFQKNKPGWANHAPRYEDVLLATDRLQGVLRHRSAHAAGVVIADRPLRELVPLYKDDEGAIIQFAMEDVETVGLLKMDVLGLETLTVIDRTMAAIHWADGVPLRAAGIPDGDEGAYALLRAGKTTGIFQFESPGMRQLLVQMRPNRIEDLTAAAALYRPGPLDAGMVDDYIARRNGLKPVTYPHELTKPYLEETHGLFIYQEQVMQLAVTLCGYTMPQADGLRKIIGKKKIDQMAAEKEKFISGAKAKGLITEEKALELWDQIEGFAAYCFNKSHSAAYAVLAYRTAYLKAHFPHEFMAALLTSAIAKKEDLQYYTFEAVQRLHIPVHAPDVNRSSTGHTVESRDGRPVAIRAGLCSVDGISDSTASVIVANRPPRGYRSLKEITDLTSGDGRKLNAVSVGRLIEAGAMDEIVPNRRSALTALPKLLKEGSDGIVSLFETETTDDYEALPEFEPDELSSRQLDALTMYCIGETK